MSLKLFKDLYMSLQGQFRPSEALPHKESQKVNYYISYTNYYISYTNYYISYTNYYISYTNYYISYTRY